MFGSRILGKEKFQEQREKEKKGANIYGHKVLGSRVTQTGSVSGPSSQQPAADTLDPADPLAEEREALEAERALLEEKRRELEAMGIKVVDGQAQLAEGQTTGEGTTSTVPEADSNGDGYLSEAEVREALEAQPELYDRLVVLEFDRGKGPRKGVSRLLLEFEQTKREGGPREDIVARLTAAIDG